MISGFRIDIIQTDNREIYFQNAMDSKMKTMISDVDRFKSVMTRVASLENEDAQLKANFSHLEAQIDELRTEVSQVM